MCARVCVSFSYFSFESAMQCLVWLQWLTFLAVAVVAHSSSSSSLAYSAATPLDLLTPFGNDPDCPECPPCFNCMLPGFDCLHFANCTESTGKCSCPAGFGGDDCRQPCTCNTPCLTLCKIFADHTSSSMWRLG